MAIIDSTTVTGSLNAGTTHTADLVLEFPDAATDRVLFLHGNTDNASATTITSVQVVVTSSVDGELFNQTETTESDEPIHFWRWASVGGTTCHFYVAVPLADGDADDEITATVTVVVGSSNTRRLILQGFIADSITQADITDPARHQVTESADFNPPSPDSLSIDAEVNELLVSACVWADAPNPLELGGDWTSYTTLSSSLLGRYNMATQITEAPGTVAVDWGVNSGGLIVAYNWREVAPPVYIPILQLHEYTR